MDVKRLLTKIRPIFARFNPQGSASSPAIRNEKLPRQSGLSEPCETSVSARPPPQGSGAWCEGRHGADARQSAESVLWCTALLWEAGGDSSEPRTRLGLVRASLLLLCTHRANRAMKNMGASFLIKPARKTPGFSHGDMRAVPFGA